MAAHQKIPLMVASGYSSHYDGTMSSLKALILLALPLFARPLLLALLLALFMAGITFGPVRAQTALSFDQQVEVMAMNEEGDFILKSGEILRPAELMLPKAGDCERLPKVCTLVKEIQGYHQQHMVGRRVYIDKGSSFHDRYNRLHAHIQSADGHWLQHSLFHQGLARVEATESSPTTTPLLLGIEANARKQEKGIWSLKAFKPLTPDIPKARMDRFQIIEGTIHKTAEVRGVIYLNFGDNWREDFTIKLAKDMRHKFADKGQSLLALKDHPIRIRGWLFWENGPMISLHNPEQLEILNQE
ncbi:thermonuclease family protein [Kiloniella sp.]|uniref:thermonuclease family protein n=1 Tax=Kiloniella sp. TaxID=1938587 RepID=UPI003B019E59